MCDDLGEHVLRLSAAPQQLKADRAVVAQAAHLRHQSLLAGLCQPPAQGVGVRAGADPRRDRLALARPRRRASAARCRGTRKPAVAVSQPSEVTMQGAARDLPRDRMARRNRRRPCRWWVGRSCDRDQPRHALDDGRRGLRFGAVRAGGVRPWSMVRREPVTRHHPGRGVRRRRTEAAQPRDGDGWRAAVPVGGLEVGAGRRTLRMCRTGPSFSPTAAHRAARSGSGWTVPAAQAVTRRSMMSSFTTRIGLPASAPTLAGLA
jgi:hypothetical protein